MKSIEVMGKNVDEAIENGLRELGVLRDMVDVEVIDQGSKGFFGRIGAKPSKVRLILRHDSIKIAKEFLDSIFEKMNIECEAHIIEENDTLKIDLDGPNMGLLIGYRGETLDSIQYLVSLVVNKGSGETEYKKVIVDTENYRKKREETLIRLANKLAYKVKKYNKSITLEPMNPYERRIIHSALQGSDYVTTHSEGDEPYRKVVIQLNKKCVSNK